MQARSPKATEPRLDLYALAQVRARELPDRWRPGAVVLGRSDWPESPRAMLAHPAWQEAVDLYLAAQVSPLDGFPECMTAWGFDALLALKSAVRTEDERQMERARSGPAGGPQFSGRRSAQGA